MIKCSESSVGLITSRSGSVSSGDEDCAPILTEGSGDSQGRPLARTEDWRPGVSEDSKHQYQDSRLTFQSRHVRESGELVIISQAPAVTELNINLWQS